MWYSVESLPTFTSVERLKSCSFAKQNTHYKYILQKWVNRPLNLTLSELSQFFCANRPVRFFARIVPVESSQGGTGFCAKRPVTLWNIKIKHPGIYAGLVLKCFFWLSLKHVHSRISPYTKIFGIHLSDIQIRMSDFNEKS